MESTPEILLVEDTPTMQVLYLSILDKAGRKADSAGTIEEARGFLSNRSYQIILLDLNLPDGDGLDLLDEILMANPATQIIVITANGSLNKAIHAMRSGAMDFLVKPFTADKLLASVDRAGEVIDTVTRVATQDGFAGMSETIKALRARIPELSQTDATLFVFGEEGLDKDYFAGLLHKNSAYSQGPMIELDCSVDLPTGPDGDLFTTALPQLAALHQRSPHDIYEHLQGGTLILKEVCGLGTAQQLELLRFLQWAPDGFILPQRSERHKVRIISTSTKDPLTEVRAGRFRRDLLSKLYDIPISIPPLRDRKEDIVPCAEEFLRLLALRRDQPIAVLSQAAKDLITEYSWPRNIKQLQAVLETAVSFYSADVIEADMLGEEIARFAQAGHDPVSGAGHNTIVPDLAVDNLVGLTLSEVEQKFIEATIARCKGSVPKAAEILNVAPSTLYRKLDSWQNSSVD
jgi:DNA-binding NtrC family response regulator